MDSIYDLKIEVISAIVHRTWTKLSSTLCQHDVGASVLGGHVEGSEIKRSSFVVPRLQEVQAAAIYV